MQVKDFRTEAVKDRLYIYTGGSTFATSTFLDSLDGEVADGTSYISLNNVALLLFSTDADFVPNNGGFEVCATTGEKILVSDFEGIGIKAYFLRFQNMQIIDILPPTYLFCVWCLKNKRKL